MHNEYEEYMMSVLGYNNRNNTDLYNENYEPNYYFTPTYNNYTRMEDNVEDLFPDIYKIINPMVCKICSNNTKPITNELLNQMTMEIYNNIQVDDLNVVNVNVQTRNVESKAINSNQIENRDAKEIKRKEVVENREGKEIRSPRPSNPLLRDLIRILILNQLLGGGAFPRKTTYETTISRSRTLWKTTFPRTKTSEVENMIIKII